jgi:DNA-binding NtrC family response regulator
VPGETLIGADLEPVRQKIAFLARLPIPVLILGESGTGKELTARGLALLSGRPPDRFISVNAATLTDPLAESLLFGHARGAFTGATERREGLLEASQGGTLFLDEIGDMSLAVQAKFLRVLEEDRYLPVGDTRPVPITARFVFATSANLHDLAVPLPETSAV